MITALPAMPDIHPKNRFIISSEKKYIEIFMLRNMLFYMLLLLVQYVLLLYITHQ